MVENRGHIDFLDSLRGVAIVSVFVCHCFAASGIASLVPSGHMPNSLSEMAALMLLPLSYGSWGVAIFFAVSGFCIHLSHQRSSQGDWAGFFIRRFFRIYPPYFIALLIFFFAHGPFSIGTYVGQFLSHALLVQNFFPDYFYGVNGAFWSISTEVQLYLLYPVVFLLAQRFGWGWAVAITGLFEISMRLYLGIFTDDPLLMRTRAVPPTFYWLSWTAGAWAAEAYLKRASIWLFSVPIWLFPSVAIVLLQIKCLSALPFLFVSLATVTVIGKLLRNSPKGTLRSMPVINSVLSFVGIVSYSIYLLHQPLTKIVASTASQFHCQHFTVFFICILAWFPILSISWGFYRIIELPSIFIGKQAISRRKAAMVCVSNVTEARAPDARGTIPSASTSVGGGE